MIDEDMECKICGQAVMLNDGCVPSDFCDGCAQEILSEVSDIVPRPPIAITCEVGVKILTALQNRIYPKRRLQREFEESKQNEPG